MVERQIRELRKIASEITVPQVVFHDAFLAIANQFNIICQYVDMPTRELYEYKVQDAYVSLTEKIDIAKDNAELFALVTSRTRELSFLRECEKTCVYMCEDYATKARASFWRRRRYQKCYEAETRHLAERRDEIERLTSSIISLQSQIDSICERDRTQYLFLTCCVDYADTVKNVRDYINALQKAIAKCRWTAQQLQYNEYSSIDDAEAQKDKAIEELFRFRDRLQFHLQKMEVLEIQGIELKKKIMQEVSTSNPRIDISDAASSDAPLNADGWDGDRANWY